MGKINLSNAQARDAVVATTSVRSAVRVRWVDDSGRQATSRRIARGTVDRDYDALLKKFGSPEAVAEALIQSDPEIDTEFYGTFLQNTRRVYVNELNEIVHHVTTTDVVLLPDGSEKERRPAKISVGNIATDAPLKWTGKIFPKRDIYNKFVFSGMVQITHVNGLTYDFLYGIAKELAEKNSLMLLGAGPKGNGKLVMRRGGLDYFGFLEGRVEGDRYALLLHLSNMELKAPKQANDAEAQS